MEKSCGVTYEEILDKGYEVLNIEGLISLCPPYGPFIAEAFNDSFNNAVILIQRKNAETEWANNVWYPNQMNNMSKKEYDEKTAQYNATDALYALMIEINNKKYDKKDRVSDLMLTAVIEVFSKISVVFGIATNAKGILESYVKDLSNHIIEGGFFNDVLTGCLQTDTLIGGNGNDILCHNSAYEDDNIRDNLHGGNGFDTYEVGNWDYIEDADGNGQIFFDGDCLAMTATYNEKNGYYENGDFLFYLLPTGLLQVQNVRTNKFFTVQSANLAKSKDKETVYQSLGITLIKKKEEEPQDPSNPDSGDGSGSGVCTGSTGCTCGTCKPPCTGTDDCDCGECSNKKETEADPVNPDGGTTTTASAVRSPIIFDLDGDCMMARIAN